MYNHGIFGVRVYVEELSSWVTMATGFLSKDEAEMYAEDVVGAEYGFSSDDIDVFFIQ